MTSWPSHLTSPEAESSIVTQRACPLLLVLNKAKDVALLCSSLQGG